MRLESTYHPIFSCYHLIIKYHITGNENNFLPDEISKKNIILKACSYECLNIIEFQNIVENHLMLDGYSICYCIAM